MDEDDVFPGKRRASDDTNSASSEELNGFSFDFVDAGLVSTPMGVQFAGSSPATEEAQLDDDEGTNTMPLTGAEDESLIENSTGNAGEQLTASRVEVAIPELSLAARSEYCKTDSEIVEMISDKVDIEDVTYYNVEFSDGREELISRRDLLVLENGRAALHIFGSYAKASANMDAVDRKRKSAPDEEWDSDLESAASDPMNLDDGDEFVSEVVRPRNRGISNRELRSLRSLRARGSTAQQSSQAVSQSPEEDEDGSDDDVRPTRARKLRSKYRLSAPDLEPDELLDDPRLHSSDDDDNFVPISSDLAPKQNRRSKARKLMRRQQLSRSIRTRPKGLSRRRSPDSDIEFEAPRRSVRTTRNVASMKDDAVMDEDSFYMVDEKPADSQKVVSVREVFQALPPESLFAASHMSTCHTCGGSRQRGQLIFCQGCSLAFHKNCLGYRSAREHIATKVGDDVFVLQCKHCIGVYRNKDKRAPKYRMCQGCKGDGLACEAFSIKRTARQEEKLREENDGVDPITPVASTLINNADIVLFRCVNCHRGWHIKHLPSAGGDAAGVDLRSERLKDYAIDWNCNECSSAKHRIHRLVAWRPLSTSFYKSNQLPDLDDVDEDNREYLVKWESISYSHCSWVSGAWLYGVAAGAMRTSFAKRALSQTLLKQTEKEAVPDEYLMADVILNVKMASNATRLKTKEDEFANISHVGKIFVKFQGLGYDDVVWDAPPTEDMGDTYNAFVDAFMEYVERKYFQQDSAHRIRDRIKAFKSADFKPVATQPAGLKRGKLMAYQVEGMNWLLQNYHHGKNVVLADEMGLGKTVQVISQVTSLIEDKPRCWPFLIVVPNATCPNWRREFKQWAPDLRVVTYHGGKESQELAYKYELFPNGSSDMKAHIVIMSYNSAQDPKTNNLFKTVRWTGLVVDEGQRLKNDQNLLYVALRSMKIPFRLLLTGTPLQNNKRELFNLLQFIDDTQNATDLDEEYAVLDKETLPKLHEMIRPYFLRRTKVGVLKFLPPMAQIILPVTMTGIQEKLSKSIMAKNPQLIKAMFANSKMAKNERGSLNNILMQLRKCLCHPFVYSEAIEEKHHDPTVLHRNLVEASSKLILLEMMLPKLRERGHRVLIFSQFLQQLDIIEDFLTDTGFEYCRLDGQISSLQKQRRIDAFNAPNSSIFAFLLSTRAGGVGINLATADTVIIMDPDFNPHQDIQAISRAHRIGQKQKVLCFQLMTKDSVEERIMQAGRKKMALDHALIESMDDDEIAGDDLESILKHGAQALFSEDYEKKTIHYDAAAIDKLLDRTQDEQTKTNEEGSAETQFSHARVWANEKSGFEDGLAIEEDIAPEPLNSSVWDRILAEREEEARKQAEATREVLGRGGRRRTAINYKTNTLESIPLPEGMEMSSESSDEFAAAAADSTDGESDEETALAKGKRRKATSTQAKPSDTATPTKTKMKSNIVNTPSKQTPKSKAGKANSLQAPKNTKPGLSPASKASKKSNGSEAARRGSAQQLLTPTKTPRKSKAKAQPQTLPSKTQTSQEGNAAVRQAQQDFPPSPGLPPSPPT